MIDAVAARGFDGLVVPVNNLDMFRDDAVVVFLNLVRDVCSAVERVHWVFVGGAFLFETLETRARRVSERFTSNPISLDPLGCPDVRTALDRRRREFAIDLATATLPISLAVSELVHDAGGGGCGSRSRDCRAPCSSSRGRIPPSATGPTSSRWRCCATGASVICGG